MNCIVADPDNYNILYIGTPAGGLWKSTDAGVSWTAITDGMPRIGISSMAIDPSSPTDNRTIYILTGDADGWMQESQGSIGVLKSLDGGDTLQYCIRI